MQESLNSRTKDFDPMIGKFSELPIIEILPIEVPKPKKKKSTKLFREWG